MNIFQSWSNSLTLFKPSSLKLFLLVTLKSIIETYKLLFTKFWYAVLIFILATFVSFLNVQTQAPVWYIVLPLLFLRGMVTWLMLFFQYLLIRPSVLKKNIEYVKGYGDHLFNSLLFFCVAILVMGLIGGVTITLVTGLMGGMSNLVPSNFGFADLILLLCAVCISIIMPFYYFFFLDSDGRFISAWRSALRAFTMVLYALPFVLAVYVLTQVIGYALQYAIINLIIMMKAPQVIVISGIYEIAFIDALSSIIIILCMPMMGCFWNNFYVKNIHENFDLYFKRREA